MKITALTGEALTAASDEDISAALTEAREHANTLFALEAPTVEQADEAVALLASIRAAEAEEARRDAEVREAGARFAAARQEFSGDGGDGGDSGEGDAEGDAEDADAEDADAEDADAEGDAEDADIEDDAENTTVDAASADEDPEGDEPEDDTEKEPVVKASANPTRSRRINPQASAVARKVGKRSARPAVPATQPVTITAAADSGFATGAPLDGLEDVTKALQNRAKAFPKFSERQAESVRAQTGSNEVLHKFGAASFGLTFDDALVASPTNAYPAVRAALAQDRFGTDGSLTAGGWCAPSEPVYSFLGGYVVDGLVSVPEVSAPRGGLMLTTGPQWETQGTALDDFGFTQTEAEAIAGESKSCEVITCPDFEDYRLDAVGYCIKIPLLTQKAYPELITDSLRMAGVLYAHKVNRRVIQDMVAESDAANAVPYGASFTDTLEALAIIAVKERRKWNLGENAVMEVKIPQFTREVFRADMSRRSNVPVDAVTNQQIDSHFAVRNLAVEYVADWEEITGADAVWPGNFSAMIFPAGTFIKAVEDVINLSAVYDAASLEVNTYTGVFFEQGILVAKAGYGSTVVQVPVCTAGTTGANDFVCEGGSPVGSL